MHATLRFFVLVMSPFFTSMTAHAMPTMCSVVNTPAFRSCMDLQVRHMVCGPIPHPCASISYYVPETYTEVVSNPTETFFHGLAGVDRQLAGVNEIAPFAAEDDLGAYAFHAHALPIPYSSAGLNLLPCASLPPERTCFTAMSEHLGPSWHTGKPDLQQPQFLAWSAAPKACLIAGAAQSLGAGSPPSGYPTTPACSSDHSATSTYPPSNHPVCTGWGIFFPRHGVTTSSDQTTASLMIASRLMSLGSEVFLTVPSHGVEKYQMILPQGSACFREGENVSMLLPKGANERGRVSAGPIKNYLYAVWKPVHCVVELPSIPAMQATLAATQAACRGVP